MNGSELKAEHVQINVERGAAEHLNTRVEHETGGNQKDGCLAIIRQAPKLSEPSVRSGRNLQKMQRRKHNAIPVEAWHGQKSASLLRCKHSVNPRSAWISFSFKFNST